MKKRTYTISNKALFDLEEIWLYTLKNWSLEQADRYYNVLIDEIEYLCGNINSGKSMDHIKKGYRASKVKSHLIFYHVSNDNIMEIIRILHERMDVKDQIKD